jgi:hypothetical protein
MNFVGKNFATGLVAAFCFFSVFFESQPVSALPSESSSASDYVSVGGAVIEVTFEGGDLSLPPARLMNWIRNSGCAVTEYYGSFPVPKVRVKVVPVPRGGGVVLGRTVMIGEIPQITVAISEFATESSLRDDWIMTHEMVHLAFPSVSEDHHWIEEGIATYVEPIARAQIGDLPAEKVWRDLMDGLPRGMPAAGDRGLDNTHTWGRTYWGGALFCLLADDQIHRRTNNRYGLQDALRGIVRAGGNMSQDWPLSRALKVGDDATGVPVLTELYNRMKATPVTTDLLELWDDLGARDSNNLVVFQQDAPHASVVRSIMARRVKFECRCGAAR